MRFMISYNHNDWAIVEPIVKFLEASGISLWLDREQIRPPMVLRLELLRAPKDTNGIITFLSGSYLASENCRMELFLARSLDKPVFPVMVEECWDALDTKEETKYLSSIFAARLAASKLVGLTVPPAEILLRLLRAIQYKSTVRRADDHNVYISYPNGAAPFATEVHTALSLATCRPWIATMNCEIGDDWRKVQVQAMARARVHVVVLSEELLSDIGGSGIEVLRTELMLSEAFQLPTLCVLSQTLATDGDLRSRAHGLLANGQQAFRRLTDRIWFQPGDIELALRKEVLAILESTSRNSG